MDETIFPEFDETIDGERSVSGKWSTLIFVFVFIVGLPVLLPVAFIGWSVFGVFRLFGLINKLILSLYHTQK